LKLRRDKLLTVPIETLVQIFPIHIPPDWAPHFEEGAPSAMMRTTSRRCDRPPYEPTFGAGVDALRGTARHDAVDITAAYGAPVVATCPGIVFVSWHYPRGNPPDRAGAGTLPDVGGYVRVCGPGGYVIYYAHLMPVLVRPGERIETGMQLGAVFHSGARGGPAHLHFQIRQPDARHSATGGTRVDPLPRLRALKSAGGWRTPTPYPIQPNPY
jgi:murein DD-endopeptidase MepM/ murein hydrolase activator NlpD